MSYSKRLFETVDHVVQEVEAICIENQHDTGDDANGNAYVRVCSDCALIIEIMEAEFGKLQEPVEVG